MEDAWGEVVGVIVRGVFRLSRDGVIRESFNTGLLRQWCGEDERGLPTSFGLRGDRSYGFKKVERAFFFCRQRQLKVHKTV